MLAVAATRNRLVHQPERGQPRERRPLGLALAAALIVTGLVGIAANLAGWDAVLAPVPSWPKMPLLAAFEMALVGSAFLALLRANRAVTLPVAAVAAAIGLLSIVGTLGAFTLPYGGMALSTALLHSTIAFAILVATASRSPRDEERALGVAGFVLITLVLMMFGATAIGVLDPMVDVDVAGSSLQTLLGSLALGAYLLGVLWASGRVTLESADWLPPGVGFASLLTVLVLWRALSVREIEQLRALTRQAGEAQHRAVSESVKDLSRSLRRAADRRVNGASAEELSLDLQSLTRDVNGLDAGLFISIADGIQISLINKTVSGLDSVWAARVAQSGRLADTVQYWPLDFAAAGFAIVAPSCNASRVCDGAVVGIVRTEQLFRTAMADTTLGFFHGVGLADGSLSSVHALSRDALRLTFEAALAFGDVQLALATWPTTSVVNRVRSQLPLVVLSMGALLSLLLVLTTLLSQNARRFARSREKARLASVLERSTDGIWEWDLNTGAADHSEGIWHNLGYITSPTLAHRDCWMQLMHADDVEGFNRELNRHLNGDTEAFEYEYRLGSNSGEWHTMVDRARIVERTPNGKPVRLLGVRADVTEARSAHASRLLNERRFRAIFDSGFQYQLLLDREGTVLEVNRVALAAGSATMETVVGQPVWNTLWWAASESARAPLMTALKSAGAGTATRYEAVVNGEGGPTSTLEIAIKPFIDQAGETNQLLLEARDITVRRRAEAALQEVDTLTTMGRVAARVAHEINNPLAGIQNSFLLIKGAVPPTHPHFAYVGAIEREIDRIAAVTRQLYETYRPEQDSGVGTSIRSLVTDAVSFLQQVNRGMHVRIETDFTNVPSVIPLPSAMLRQIFYNLAQNAIEASPTGELVTIRAELRAREFTLSVRDRGAGVPNALRERIFDPFFSTKDRGVRTGGMGLGLALVRRTVTAAGGTISITDAPDQGTIFTVTLPVPSGAQGEAG
ncbi:MAG: PAS domain S-box protein [Phycisphaerae bacterium]|nr:PAS domain S-box protein [Gemmatimonadaceae bacterium]